MTAPRERAGGLDANARGIAVLVAAVLVGFLLLLNAGGGGDDDATAAGDGGSEQPTGTTVPGGDTATTTTEGGAAATTTTTEAGTEARSPAEVSVVVLNGSGLTGVAGAASETIGAAGYQMGNPDNANSRLDATAVYFAEGYEPEAVAVAEVLGKASDIVTPMPPEAPGPGADTANVVVVLGADTPPAGEGGAAGGTTTTTAG